MSISPHVFHIKQLLRNPRIGNFSLLIKISPRSSEKGDKPFSGKLWQSFREIYVNNHDFCIKGAMWRFPLNLPGDFKEFSRYVTCAAKSLEERLEAAKQKISLKTAGSVDLPLHFTIQDDDEQNGALYANWSLNLLCSTDIYCWWKVLYKRFVSDLNCARITSEFRQVSVTTEVQLEYLHRWRFTFTT